MLAGLCYIEARGVKRDEDAGLSLYRNGSGVSTAQAQYEIGLALLEARAWGTEPNVERAVAWLQRAADAEHIDAMVSLAPILRNGSKVGQGYVTKDVSRSMRLLEKAALNGHAGAQVAMAQDFLTGGYGVAQNVTRAMELLSLAARTGSVDAKVLLGKLIAGASLPGLDAATHAQEAGKGEGWGGGKGEGWGGRGDLRLMVADCIARVADASDGGGGGGGVGGEILRVVVGCLQAAAEAGSARAQVELGKHLLSGKGVPCDPQV
jgi:TPR repeat protein